MADWSKPTVSSTYVNYTQEVSDRDVDAATLFVNTPTNQPTGAIRYNRSSDKFQEWDGAAWQDKVLSIAGGGTGSASASGARNNLGLGSMAVQDSTAVSITGGSITTLTGFSVGCDILFATDGNRNIGSDVNRPNILYLRNGLVIPVGTDKWVT